MLLVPWPCPMTSKPPRWKLHKSKVPKVLMASKVRKLPKAAPSRVVVVAVVAATVIVANVMKTAT